MCLCAYHPDALFQVHVLCQTGSLFDFMLLCGERLSNRRRSAILSIAVPSKVFVDDGRTSRNPKLQQQHQRWQTQRLQPSSKAQKHACHGRASSGKQPGVVCSLVSVDVCLRANCRVDISEMFGYRQRAPQITQSRPCCFRGALVSSFLVTLPETTLKPLKSNSEGPFLNLPCFVATRFENARAWAARRSGPAASPRVAEGLSSRLPLAFAVALLAQWLACHRRRGPLCSRVGLLCSAGAARIPRKRLRGKLWLEKNAHANACLRRRGVKMSGMRVRLLCLRRRRREGAFLSNVCLRSDQRLSLSPPRVVHSPLA